MLSMAHLVLDYLCYTLGWHSTSNAPINVLPHYWAYMRQWWGFDAVEYQMPHGGMPNP